MKKNLLLLAVAFGCITSSFATIHTITVQDFSFSPSTLSVHTGDTIMWMRTGGSHTTTSASIPAGAAAWNQALNATTPTFMYVPTIAGTYNYVCTPHASMGMTGSFTVSSLTNVPSVSQSDGITVFPNPASDQISVLIAGTSTPARVSVFDAMGREVFSREYSMQQAAVIPVSSFASGTYFVTTVQEGNIERRRIMVAH